MEGDLIKLRELEMMERPYIAHERRCELLKVNVRGDDDETTLPRVCLMYREAEAFKIFEVDIQDQDRN